VGARNDNWREKWEKDKTTIEKNNKNKSDIQIALKKICWNRSISNGPYSSGNIFPPMKMNLKYN